MVSTGGTLSTKMIELVGDLNIGETVKNINRSITEIERSLRNRDAKVQLNVELFGRIKDLEKDISALQRKINSSSSIKNIKLGVELKDTTVKDINEQIRLVQNKVDGSSVNKLKLDIDFDFKGSASKIKEEMQGIQQFMERYGKQINSTKVLDLSDDAQEVASDVDRMIGSVRDLGRGTSQVSTDIESKMREMTGSTGKFAVTFSQDINGAINKATASLTDADGTIRKFNYALDDSGTKLIVQSRNIKEAGDQSERLATSMKQVEDAQRKLNTAIASSPEGINRELIEQAQNHLNVARSMEEQGRVTNEGSNALKELNNTISLINNNTKNMRIAEEFEEMGDATRIAITEFERLGGSRDDIDRFTNSMKNMSQDSVAGMKELKQEVQDATNEIIQSSNRIDGALSDIARQDFARAIDERDIDSIRKYVEEIYGAKVETIRLTEQNDKLGNSVDRLKVSMQAQNGAMTSYTLDMQKGFEGTDRALRQVNESTKTVTNSNMGLKDSFGQIVGRVTQYIGVIEVIQAGMQAIRATITEILAIDAQMTELARVADPSINMNVLLRESVGMAQELGASVEEVVGSVAEMARTFGEFNEAQLMAVSQTAILMDNVSDLNLAQSTETLVGTMRAFNIEAEDSIMIVNELNEVNFISLPVQKCA